MHPILSQAHWKINKQIPKLDRSLMNWKMREIIAHSQKTQNKTNYVPLISKTNKILQWKWKHFSDFEGKKGTKFLDNIKEKRPLWVWRGP